VNRQAVYFTGPRRSEVKEEPVPELRAGMVLIQSVCSAISPGTELMIYRGDAPDDLPADERIGALSGGLRFPLKYGYATVGKVVSLGEGVDPTWEAQRVFAFNPHETLFLASPAELIKLPDAVSWETGTFLANMETAVNFIHDGRPMLGELVVVLGQGVVGLLTTMLLHLCPLAGLVTVEPIPRRRDVSLSVGADASLDPSEEGAKARLLTALEQIAGDRADLVFEVSGSPQALDLALSLTGFDGRIIIGSWYGQKRATLDLGGRFHRSRVQLKSSQVTTVDPRLSGRWSKSRRLATALEMLTRIDLARLITHRYPIAKAADAYELLDTRPQEAIQVIFEHHPPEAIRMPAGEE
jgi:2-desacetyl-2-hydroxyethyl bacteriochlorophyllide A dehydrogenase